ncbi:hypothetical protein BS17DRAFT_697712 [Gyrodon lividus]|nr:hypothetical protein BS17DRAFT_697712 [Gyrodon lividus]
MVKVIRPLKQQVAHLTKKLEAKEEPVVGSKLPNKFELITDPAPYIGNQEQFTKWCTKINIWIRGNQEGMEDEREVACVVWSPMKGETSGQYLQTSLNECLEIDVCPIWLMVQNLKQGTLQVNVTEFLSFFWMARISDQCSIYLLERNANPSITNQVYLTGKRKTQVMDAAMAIREIGRA